MKKKLIKYVETNEFLCVCKSARNNFVFFTAVLLRRFDGKLERL